MGTFLKKGMNFFPVSADISYDSCLVDVAGDYGPIVYEIYMKLMSQIAKNGYYVNWCKRFVRTFNKSLSMHIQIDKLNKIVSQMCSNMVFDNVLFTDLQILTSVSIQEDYLRAVKRRKNQQPIETKYLLVGLDRAEKSKGQKDEEKFLDENEENENVDNLQTSCEHTVDKMCHRREEKRKEEKRRDEKRKEDCGVFASLTHTQSAGAHVCEGKSPKKHQIEIFSKELIEKPGWIDELKATRIASERFFTDIEGYMRAYCSWLFVTGADKSIETLTDFSRRFYYWISKHGNKLRPEELERKDSAEKKETSEERFLRMRKEMLEQERMEEESRFQNSIN